ELTCRWSYVAIVPFQCSCNEPRLEITFFFLQSCTYQFSFAQQFLDSTQHNVTADSQTLKLRIACAVTNKLIRPAVCGQQFRSRKHVSKILYHPELGHGS